MRLAEILRLAGDAVELEKDFCERVGAFFCRVQVDASCSNEVAIRIDDDENTMVTVRIPDFADDPAAILADIRHVIVEVVK